MSVQKAKRQFSWEPQGGSFRNAMGHICSTQQSIMQRSLGEPIQVWGAAAAAAELSLREPLCWEVKEPAQPQQPWLNRTAAGTWATAMGCALVTVISQTSWHCTDFKKPQKLKKTKVRLLSHDVCFKIPPFGLIFLLCIFKNLGCDINSTFSQSQTLGSDNLFTFENNLALTSALFFLTSPHNNNDSFFSSENLDFI